MATSKEYMSFVIDQLSELEQIRYISMMGEYIIYYREKVAAYVCDNNFLVKSVDAAKAILPNAPLQPPYDGAKDMLLVEDIENKELLTQLFTAMYDELPERKPKKPKSKKA